MTSSCRDIEGKNSIIFFRKVPDKINLCISDMSDGFCITTGNGDKYKVSVAFNTACKIILSVEYLNKGSKCPNKTNINFDNCNDSISFVTGIGFEIYDDFFTIFLLNEGLLHSDKMYCFQKAIVKKNNKCGFDLKLDSLQNAKIMFSLPLEEGRLYITKQHLGDNVSTIRKINDSCVDKSLSGDNDCKFEVFDNVSDSGCAKYVGNGVFKRYIYTKGSNIGFGCDNVGDYDNINTANLFSDTRCAMEKESGMPPVLLKTFNENSTHKVMPYGSKNNNLTFNANISSDVVPSSNKLEYFAFIALLFPFAFIVFVVVFCINKKYDYCGNKKNNCFSGQSKKSNNYSKIKSCDSGNDEDIVMNDFFVCNDENISEVESESELLIANNKEIKEVGDMGVSCEGDVAANDCVIDVIKNDAYVIQEKDVLSNDLHEVRSEALKKQSDEMLLFVAND